jgi:hypothetical protein
MVTRWYAHELQILLWRAPDFQAQLYSFTDPFGDLVEGRRLRVA